MRSSKIDKILDVTEEICAERGPSGVQLQEIAARLGIKPPSIYRYFDGIDAILCGVMDRGMREMLAAYHGIEGLAPMIALETAHKRQIEVLLARPGFTRLALRELAQPDDDAPEKVVYRGKFKQQAEIERKLFLELVEHGLAPDIPFRDWYAMRLGTIFTLLSFEWTHNAKIPPERLEVIREIASRPYFSIARSA